MTRDLGVGFGRLRPTKRWVIAGLVVVTAAGFSVSAVGASPAGSGDQVPVSTTPTTAPPVHSQSGVYTCVAAASGNDAVVTVSPSPGTDMQYTAAPGGGPIDNQPPSSVGPISVVSPGTPATFTGLATPPPNFLVWNYQITAVSTAVDPITHFPLVVAQCDFQTPQSGRGIALHVAFQGPGRPLPGSGSNPLGPPRIHFSCGAVQHDFAVHSDALLLGGLPNGVPCQVTGLPYPGATSITYDPCVGVTIGGPEVTNPDYCPNNNTVLYSAGDPPSEANLYVNWFIPAITAPPNFTG